MSTEHGRAETEEERTTEVVLGSTLVFQSFKILTSVSSFNRTRVLKLQDYLAIKCYYSSFFSWKNCLHSRPKELYGNFISNHEQEYFREKLWEIKLLHHTISQGSFDIPYKLPLWPTSPPFYGSKDRFPSNRETVV